MPPILKGILSALTIEVLFFLLVLAVWQIVSYSI